MIYNDMRCYKMQLELALCCLAELLFQAEQAEAEPEAGAEAGSSC